MSKATNRSLVATGLLFPEEEPTLIRLPAKPALKWAGGKRWLLPHLFPVWQRYTTHRLVEPFVGGMSIALGLQPQRAYLSDINEHLVNFYQWLQSGLVVEREFLHEEAAFYEARTRFNELIRQQLQRSPEAAALFYYLNRTCFNGLCRFNKKNEFNVPFGRYRAINYTRDFTAYRAPLSNWQLAHHSFEHTPVENGDFIYADPPYDTPFSQYAKEDFTWADQEKLVRWLNSYDVPIVTTNQATPRILELYQDSGFQIQLLAAPRRISCTGDRTPAQEMLATKNL